MFRLSLLVIFAIVANAVALPALRIVGGSDADIKDAPYQVAMLFDFSNSGVFTIACGGTIISPSAILSAAQCTYGSIASRWRIRAGSSLHNSGGQVIPVSSFHQHDEYNPRTLENDIVALFLSSDIILDFAAQVVSLPLEGLEIGDDVNCFVTGWGKTTAGGSTPEMLKKVIVRTINQQICKNAYSGILAIANTMVCAGRFGLGGADACQGDTGGPMVTWGILYGIISWGIGCGEPMYPGVYTKVPMFRKWIDSNLQFASLDRISAAYDSRPVAL